MFLMKMQGTTVSFSSKGLELQFQVMGAVVPSLWS